MVTFEIMDKKALGVAALLGSGLAVIWMFAVGYHATSWLSWTVLGCAVVALAGLGPAAMAEMPGVGTWPLVGTVLISAWLFAMAVGATRWLAWLSLGFGVRVRDPVGRVHREEQQPGAAAPPAPRARTSLTVASLRRRRRAAAAAVGARPAAVDARRLRCRRTLPPTAPATAAAGQSGRRRAFRPAPARHSRQGRVCTTAPGGVGVPVQSLMSDGKLQPPGYQAQAVQLALC